MDRKKLTLCFLAEANSVHTQKWLAYFVKRGHRVHLLSFTPLEKAYDSGASFHLLINKVPIKKRSFSFPLNLLPNIFQLRRTIKKINPDILHAHDAVNYGRFSAFIGFHPFIITPWGTDLFIKSRKGLQKAFTRFALKRADLITTDGENTKETMEKHFGIDDKKIAMVRFGIDTKKFKPMAKDESLKMKLHLGNGKVVISLRTLARSHGVATLIKAIPYVIKRVPDSTFIIAGDTYYDKPYMSYIMNLVTKLHLLPSIRFVGLIPNNELPSYLNLADVYVSTGLSDSGLSSSTAEAMACALPVVVSDSGDNRKWVKEGGGFIFPVKDHKMFADAIATILEKEQNERLAFGKVNRAIVVKNNDYETEMAKMEDLYYSLLPS